MSTPVRCPSGGWPPIVAAGMVCRVAAPSKLQQPAGDRVKTDARDAAHIGRPTGAPVVVDKRRHRECPTGNPPAPQTITPNLQTPDPLRQNTVRPAVTHRRISFATRFDKHRQTSAPPPPPHHPLTGSVNESGCRPPGFLPMRPPAVHYPQFPQVYPHCNFWGIQTVGSAFAPVPGCGCGSSAGRFAMSSTGPGPPRKRKGRQHRPARVSGRMQRLIIAGMQSCSVCLIPFLARCRAGGRLTATQSSGTGARGRPGLPEPVLHPARLEPQPQRRRVAYRADRAAPPVGRYQFVLTFRLEAS